MFPNKVWISIGVPFFVVCLILGLLISYEGQILRNQYTNSQNLIKQNNDLSLANKRLQTQINQNQSAIRKIGNIKPVTKVIQDKTIVVQQPGKTVMVPGKTITKTVYVTAKPVATLPPCPRYYKMKPVNCKP